MLSYDEAFLSWLRLSVYMAVVSVAITLSFHLKSKPSETGMHVFSSSPDLVMSRRNEMNAH